ncbi:MAG: helix-turn-helix domain-containing protein [Paracoccaceae bacterium]|nr:helix-turn-helix domain-containing protein [Paracoccaceae bacterium]
MHCHATASKAQNAPAIFGISSGETNAEARIAELFSSRLPVSHVLPDRAILLHGEPADTLYQIVSGTVRCCTFSEDGVRQIFRFASAGDYLGFSDFETWHFTAEAVDHVILRAIPRRRAEGAIARDPSLQLGLREMMCRELAARERHMFMLAYMPAEDRLRRFLCGFAARRGAAGFTVLPMPRRDIADHIGLTVETVSRAFSSLKRKGEIEMRGCDRFRVVTEQTLLAA